MPSLAVVGAAPGAGEVSVARALAGDAGSVAVPLALGGEALAGAVVGVSLPGSATPLVAARHARVELDPAELVASARGEDVVVALSGGPYAPLTPRYAVRDLARAVALPAIVAVAPEPGFPALALAAAAALRAGGVAVAAIVVVGRPDPPDRVQLDERDVLREVADVPVEVLAAGARLDAAPWLAGAARSSDGPSVTTVREVTLDPYRAWVPRALSDPRETPRPRIMEAMLEIAAAEGPMTASRAYSVYARAAGGRKLTSAARAPLSSAVYWLARDGRIALTRGEQAPWQGDDLVRLPDAPAVRVRELGPRTLDEVPVDEIGELIRRIRGARGRATDEQTKRAILDAYGLVRMTAKASEYLDRALARAGD